MADDKNNPFGEPTTGHLWDDNLCELTNPPPKWWMMALHASWIFVLVYGIIYPMWPMASGHTAGFTGWTSIGEFKKGVAEVDAKREKYEDMLDASATQILANDEAVNYIERAGKVLFGDKCAACHGSGGQGNPGFPSLADNDWLYGGKVDTIVQTITNGRHGVMPKMGGQKLTEAEIGKLADAIVGGKVTSEPLFMAKGCIACHATRDASGEWVSQHSPEHFCQSCHSYAGVKIDCFDCHTGQPE